MELGTKKRLTRIFNPETNRTILVPMDHGMTILAPQGIVNIRKAVDDMHEGGANAVIMHKGLIRASGLEEANAELGLIMHITASTEFSPNGNTKVLTGSVEEAIRLGADAVSVHLNLGDANERIMLENAGKIADDCNRWGMPLLMMLYGRGGLIRDSFAVDVVAQCARVGAELGADIVKVSYTGSPESFERVTACCCCPVVIAGGERINSTRKLLQMVWESLQAGGAGLSIGRNVFDHPRRIALMKALNAMVHHNATVDEGLEIVGED
ncbi:MAG: class I fructose-bisphosphate aldolase family protein [Mailhella sp.]|nr:class I fructose-bisphosphate aldolase family protein [Mailhella sp.]